jgi:hypothetical protein
MTNGIKLSDFLPLKCWTYALEYLTYHELKIDSVSRVKGLI